MWISKLAYMLDQMFNSHSHWLVDQSVDEKISAWLMERIVKFFVKGVLFSGYFYLDNIQIFQCVCLTLITL